MVILFNSTKGGVGKTTLATHLVLFLANGGRKVALVDGDNQRSATQWVAEASPGVRIKRVATPDSCVETVSQLRQSHDVVVCDSPGGDSEVSRTLMLVADLVLFPVGPSILDLRSLARATSLLRYAQQINRGRPTGRVVLNKVKKRDRISVALPDATSKLGVKVLQSQVRDLEALRDAAQQATSATRLKRQSSHAKRDLEAVCDEILTLAQACVAAEPREVLNA